MAGKELGCERGGCGSRYADIICIFCTRNETILPFMSAKMSWMLSPYSIKHVQVICIFNSYTDYYNLTHEVIIYPRMSYYLTECEMKLVSFINLPQSSFIYIGSFAIFIAIHVAHLNTVYDKANFCTGGWGKPILIYHMIDQLSIIVNFNDRQKVKDSI